jgi:hypothetical protein
MAGSWSKCGMCSEEFSGLSNFDAHLIEVYKVKEFSISCSPPESIGMIRNENGYWTTPLGTTLTISRPASVQLLECSKCHKMWEREPKRGRTPKFCPSCA